MKSLIYIAFTLLFCCVGCRLKGPSAEASLGITAEEVYEKMIEAIDPEGDLTNAKVCIMEREVIEMRENILGNMTEHISLVTTTLRKPDCINMTTTYGPGNYKWLIINKDGAWKRDLAGRIKELTGKNLEAAKFKVKKAMLSGVKQRDLWESITLEESDVFPEKWYRLVLNPKEEDVDPEVNYVNKKTFLLERVVVEMEPESFLSPLVSITCDIENYKMYDDVLVPTTMRYSAENDIIPPTEMRLKRFEIKNNDNQCNCSFEPYIDDENCSATCEIHSPLNKDKKSN